MENYKITVAYDGTRYSGWQRQNNTDKSIQGKIEEVLTKMCGHNVEIHGSGRTDAGVHAIGQVANFKIETDKTTDEIHHYLNEYLPEDIAVTDICTVGNMFHARLAKCQKTYLYRINNSDISLVFDRKYVYKFPEKLDVDKMRKAAESLIGTHDFLGFSSLKRVKKSTVRTIYDVKIEKSGNEIKIYITGDGFLYNMVRIIIGTLIEIGSGKVDTEIIKRVLESKKRQDAGFTAPGCGLTLFSVVYDTERG
ncbi:MAG: tRNA pseudouridine(38-40) synthase TruA [Clostridia bacterium]